MLCRNELGIRYMDQDLVYTPFVQCRFETEFLIG